MATQDPILICELAVGKYRIVFDRQCEELWLRNADDEGMTLEIDDLERLLDQHFKANF